MNPSSKDAVTCCYTRNSFAPERQATSTEETNGCKVGPRCQQAAIKSQFTIRGSTLRIHDAVFDSVDIRRCPQRLLLPNQSVTEGWMDDRTCETSPRESWTNQPQSSLSIYYKGEPSESHEASAWVRGGRNCIRDHRRDLMYGSWWNSMR